MRRLNGGAGVAPALSVSRTQESGSPWVSVRPHYEGPPSQEGRYGPDEGRRKPPGDGPDEPVPGWKTPQVERREAACPKGTRHRKVQTQGVRLSALHSLTLRGRKG